MGERKGAGEEAEKGRWTGPNGCTGWGGFIAELFLVCVRSCDFRNACLLVEPFYFVRNFYSPDFKALRLRVSFINPSR